MLSIYHDVSYELSYWYCWWYYYYHSHGNYGQHVRPAITTITIIVRDKLTA